VLTSGARESDPDASRTTGVEAADRFPVEHRVVPLAGAPATERAAVDVDLASVVDRVHAVMIRNPGATPVEHEFATSARTDRAE
jgi:hypothetical protein